MKSVGRPRKGGIHEVGPRDAAIYGIGNGPVGRGLGAGGVGAGAWGQGPGGRVRIHYRVTEVTVIR